METIQWNGSLKKHEEISDSEAAGACLELGPVSVSAAAG
jgi:hypothetical protein